MSKENKAKSNKIIWKSDKNLPSLDSLKENWDLAKLFYKNDKDPRIESDIVITEKAFEVFAKKYRAGKWTKDNNSILKAVKEYLELEALPGSKPLYYYSYRQQLDATDTLAERALNKLSERLTRASNNILFFPLALAKLPKGTQKELLKDPKVGNYRWFLEGVFDDAKYQLSEPEEKILSLKSMTSRGLWINGTEKIVNKKTIKWKVKTMPMHGA